VAVLINRTHLVTFRLSLDEYESLRNTCTAEGARSISDFARTAVLYQLKTRNSERVNLADDLTTLGVNLGELDGVLRALSRRISQILGNGIKDKPVRDRPDKRWLDSKADSVR
jgi:hypothetical protein